MGFWGLEVKPGQTVPYDSEVIPGRLHITQATLGTGTSSKKSVLQCIVGDNDPIFLCSLLPDKIENCSLNLEFEDDGVVTFSTIGPRSIHLSGFIENDGQDDYDGDDYENDSYGEDIAESDSDGSSDMNTDDTLDDDFSDDDDDVLMFPHSPVPNSGVVIEEIVDEEKPAPGNNPSKHSKKKSQLIGNDDSDASQKQIVVKHSSSVPMSESEDEDGFPVQVPTHTKVNKQGSKPQEPPKSKSKDSKKKRNRDEVSTKAGDTSVDQQKREENKASDSSFLKAGAAEISEQPKKKKQNLTKELKKAEVAGTAFEKTDEEIPAADDKMKSETEINSVTDGDQSSEKKKRKKKKKNKTEDKAASSADLVEKKTEAKASHVRGFPNGLVIEELKMGKPDGKRASPGKRVSVNYIGKLKKNGSIFDSNVGRAPFKFHLGVGKVIKGWDVGINGMRVGDKRRLTIPPSMGYGAQGAGHKIPPNSWLMFDVELLDVN